MVVNGEKIKPVLIKLLIISNKGFNNNIPLNDNFFKKLTKKLGSLKINESIKVINEDSYLIKELINQFNTNKIDMAKPLI